VLLIDEGRVKLVDSWLLPPAEVMGDLAHYRAPELSEGQAATTTTAVYALGLLLFELITGERPVAGTDARATALAHLTARIPPLRQARPGLYLPTAEALLARATARSPAQRFPDARAFSEALDSLWRDLGAGTQRLGPTPGRASEAVARRPDSVADPAPPILPTTGLQPGVAPDLLGAPPAGKREPARRARRTGPLAHRGVDPNALRRSTLTHNLVGWLVMVGLMLIVAFGSYLAVNALANGFGGLPRLGNVPGLPQLPTSGNGGPLGWLGGLFGGHEQIYIVNIAAGLNLRREPSATDTANVIVVVPNGALVHKLDGPRVEGNIPWLRVRAEVDGVAVEGWMSMNYLLPKE
jgi:hypothetical protein